MENLNRLRVPPPAGLTFDPGPHQYFWKGTPVPNVTRVLAPIEDWSFLGEEEKEWYAARGTAVHIATALDDLGDLVEESVDPAIAGYLESWRKLRTSSGMEIVSVEELVYDEVLGCAGTMDRRAILKDKRPRHAVIDLKAGVKLVSHGVQVFGYRRLWNRGKPRAVHIEQCYTAYLQKDGAQGKLVEWVDELHESQFVSLLTMYRWNQRYSRPSQGESHAKRPERPR